MMRKATKIIIVAELLVFLAIGLGVVLIRDIQEKRVAGYVQKSRPQSPPVTQDEKTPPPPLTLQRPIIVSAKLSEEQERKAREGIEEMVEALKNQPDLYSHWLELGILRKLIGDFEGAAEAWEYAALVAPGESIPLNNLGDLYAYHLRDPQRAETYFLGAIERAPGVPYIYYTVYEFYRYLVKDIRKAKGVLERGMKEIPSEGGFKKLLADLSTS